MPATPNSPTAVRRFGYTLLILALLFAVAVLFQRMEGAYQSEFGGHPDEAAHYVTGLFVHDSVVFIKNYALSGFHGSPVATVKKFVTDYYDHYPKIGLGVWPPVFYVLQTAWTFCFSPDRTSVLLLMALFAAAVGTILYRAVQEEYGVVAGMIAGCLWLSLPLSQEYYGMVMAEMLSTITMFGATLLFGRFLDEGKPRHAIYFGLLASAAILTKGTGLALAFVPVFSIVLTNRYDILKRKALWIAALLVGVLAGPWTLKTRKLGEGGWEEPHPSLHFTKLALPYYGWKLIVAVGIILFVLAVVGAAIRLSRRRESVGKWACCVSLVVAIIIFQSIAPAGREARHLMPALPAMLMLAVAGFFGITSFGGNKLLRPALAVVLLGLFYGLPAVSHDGANAPSYGSIGDSVKVSPFGIHQKGAFGFGPVAEKLLETAPRGEFLVSSDATGEGMFIAEVAMHDKNRPNCVAKRASKELASAQWGGGGYSAKFENAEGVVEYFKGAPFQYLVVDTAIPERNLKPHHKLLIEAAASHPELFEPVFEPQALMRNNERMPGPILTYRIHGK
jgi:hypothetical protein